MLLLNNVDFSTMPFGSALLQSSLHQNVGDWDDNTYQSNLEEPNNCLASIWTREEKNSWENTDSVEYYVDSTAVNKQLDFTFSNDTVNAEWKTKSVKHWESHDIMCWIISVANENDRKSEDICISQFNNIDGKCLLNMSKADFVSLEPQHGEFLYSTLQQLMQEQEQVDSLTKLPPVSTIKSEERDYYPLLLNLNSATTCNTEGHHSSDESEGGINASPSLTGKRRPGRPRIPGRRGKKPEKKTGRLWEFIRDLLLNRDYCPSLICWENYEEGVFRFVRSEKVAKLWGTLKENPKMTYEKLSRAMRYYYKSKVLQPVLGRRLVYKFGPSATGWRTPNPNFRV